MNMRSPERRLHRICHVNLAGGFRGGERQTELLIRELAKRGWAQRLVARAGGALAARCRGVEDLEIAEVVPNPLPAAIAARGSALVHAHEARAVYSGWLLKCLRKTPYVITRRIDHALRDTFVRTRAYRAADCIVAISTSIANTVQSHYPEIRCRIIPSAHADMTNNCAAVSAIRSRLKDRFIVGHVGELHHAHKGQHTIIEAARELRRAYPHLHFMLVGTGRDEQAFRMAAEGLDNVELTGFVENVEDYMAAFDVFLYPSLSEGLGSSLLDAMCFGLPIVASDVGGIPEIVEHRVNGLLIRPESRDDLVAALRRLIDDPALRAAMSRENRAKSDRYGAPRMAESYETVYGTILGHPAVARPERSPIGRPTPL